MGNTVCGLLCSLQNLSTRDARELEVVVANILMDDTIPPPVRNVIAHLSTLHRELTDPLLPLYAGEPIRVSQSPTIPLSTVLEDVYP